LQGSIVRAGSDEQGADDESLGDEADKAGGRDLENAHFNFLRSQERLSAPG
jgi:hypothetical protein